MVQLPFDRLLRRDEVERWTGLSTSSIYRKISEGTFPQPIKVGDRAVRWYESEIRQWLSERPRAGGYGNQEPAEETATKV